MIDVLCALVVLLKYLINIITFMDEIQWLNLRKGQFISSLNVINKVFTCLSFNRLSQLLLKLQLPVISKIFRFLKTFLIVYRSQIQETGVHIKRVVNILLLSCLCAFQSSLKWLRLLHNFLFNNIQIFFQRHILNLLPFH